MENSRAESLMKHVGSPSSDVMETLTLYGSMILMGLVIIGAIYELGRFIRGNISIFLIESLYRMKQFSFLDQLL